MTNEINENKIQPLERFIENFKAENQFLEKKNQVVSLIFTLFVWDWFHLCLFISYKNKN